MVSPFRAQLAQQLVEQLLFRQAQPGGGLVQQEQDGVGGERAGDFEDALLASGRLPAGCSITSSRPTRRIWRMASARIADSCCRSR